MELGYRGSDYIGALDSEQSLPVLHGHFRRWTKEVILWHLVREIEVGRCSR